MCSQVAKTVRILKIWNQQGANIVCSVFSVRRIISKAEFTVHFLAALCDFAAYFIRSKVKNLEARVLTVRRQERLVSTLKQYPS